MRNVVLHIAMSLDGYIADVNGGVDWLQIGADETSPDQEEESDSYSELSKTVDTVLMGWKTYEQVVTELSPDEWVYGDFESYVFTHRSCKTELPVHFIDEDPADVIRSLREKEGKDIWICGGANLIAQLIRQDLIDRYVLTIIPVLLGQGIRLFEGPYTMQKLELVSQRRLSQMAELVYSRKRDAEPEGKSDR
ncbi:dihydrofolate reductase family protein [Allobaculum mucilyticum]|uniref:dihydrofolate reductase family protein n=1 Tax=Allobaculum mucilyticum TaxID=2834459 RepID=UPI001E2E0B4C|nr:dihydrofolate reductase family protein [Allobaculum mucilyticum]UNT96412.1 dihydrofolate reductase family protein [Allobaculum mucilyticum]